MWYGCLVSHPYHTKNIIMLYRWVTKSYVYNEAILSMSSVWDYKSISCHADELLCHRISSTKMCLKISSAKWQPFGLGLNVLKHCVLKALTGMCHRGQVDDSAGCRTAQALQQQIGQEEVTEVIDPELELVTVLGLPSGTCADTCNRKKNQSVFQF